MKTWFRIILITLGTAVPAFVLGPIVWPPDPHVAAPVGFHSRCSIVLAALEALAFGLGLVFIGHGSNTNGTKQQEHNRYVLLHSRVGGPVSSEGDLGNIVELRLADNRTRQHQTWLAIALGCLAIAVVVLMLVR